MIGFCQIKHVKFLFIISLVLLFGVSCTTNAVTTNYSHLYSKELSRLHPDFIVYHHRVDSSRVYFKVKTDEMLYVRKDKSEPYRSNVIIHYRLYNTIDSKVLVDSASRLIEDVTEEKLSREIVGSFNIKAEKGKNYLLKIWTTDFHRSSVDEKHVNVIKQGNGSQFFLLSSTTTHQPIFTNYLTKSGEFSLTSAMNKNSILYERCYYRNFPLASPPFSTVQSKSFKYQPDKTEALNLDEQGAVNFTLQDSGFVYFQIDTTTRQGYTLYRYDENFPKIQSLQGMIGPLRYICTKSEYLELTSSTDIKKSLDKFWQSKTGSNERSRELIKRYYNRVEEANRLFSSYLEGWKTDRGMISMIFGPPSVVNKFSDNETWIYGDETNVLSLRFTFYKVNNPFSDNDYKLNRGPGYRSSWYRAVDAWRSGRVYWVQ